MSNMLTTLLWLLFFVLIGCVLIIGPSVVDVDHSVRRPVLESPDTLDNIDWIDWDN